MIDRFGLLGLGLLVAFLGLLVGYGQRSGTGGGNRVFAVNTTQDTIDAAPGDGRCADSNGRCSLRAAIMETNALRIPVVIQIPAGVYTLTRTILVDEQGGDLNLRGEITFRGAGEGRTILDGNGTTRVIRVHEGAKVILEGLTIRNGKASEPGGGGLLIDRNGTAAITNVAFIGNSSEYNGGGLLNIGTIILNNVTFSENGAEWGGGLANGGTTIIVNGVFVSNNGGFGGGLFNAGAAALINVTFTRNIASLYGGGLVNGETLALINTTFSNNAAEVSGGGLANNGVARISFSTFTLNRTKLSGGGIFSFEGKSVEIKGVILSGNATLSGDGPECQGSLLSRGYNLIKNNDGCNFIATATDIPSLDAYLAPLANNGGWVQTHLPRPGSPALNRVPAHDCTTLNGDPVTTDARGVDRPQGPACDIGAVERRPSE